MSWLRWCLPFVMGYVGVYVGVYAGAFAVGVVVARPAAERMRAEHPEGFVCGNMFLPPLMLGMVVGGGAGFCAGRRACNRFWPAVPTRCEPDHEPPHRPDDGSVL